MIQTTQDMDISPGDSTPTSEVSYGGNNSSSQLNANEQNSTMGPVLLANALPRLISHPIHVPSTPVSLYTYNFFVVHYLFIYFLVKYILRKLNIVSTNIFEKLRIKE